MRNRYPRRQRAAAFAGILAVALAMAAGAGNAFAQNAGDDDEALDTKLFRKFMRELGFRQSEEGIEYRERAPLVVPPGRDLPPPQPEGAIDRNPAWPKDPDVARRREATAAEKAKLKSTTDHPTDESRPLRPDEMKVRPVLAPAAAGTTAAGPTAAGPTAAAPSAEEAARPLSPSQLGGGTNWFGDIFSKLGPAKPEAAPFTGEPPRTSMTAPPAGYQTPSPSYPYGMGVQVQVSKPSTLEQRLEAPK
jgi:hypothetical protein